MIECARFITQINLFIMTANAIEERDIMSLLILFSIAVSLLLLTFLCSDKSYHNFVTEP
jgi:hypothetical protein